MLLTFFNSIYRHIAIKQLKMKTIIVSTLFTFCILQNSNAQLVNEYLNEQIEILEKEVSLIPDERVQILNEIASEITHQLNSRQESKIVFVCTHNSRRSQASELWLRAAVKYFKLNNIQSYSGGTAVTAFNPRMVKAFVRKGFFIQKTKGDMNPNYIAKLADKDSEKTTMFSKRYDDTFNPSNDFIAVMVCSQADKDCPLVPGATARVSLPYEDPKHYDNTPQETKAYNDKVNEIGREMIYIIKTVKNNIHNG